MVLRSRSLSVENPLTWRETYEAWLNSPALSEEEWKELDAIRNDDKEIEDRFYAPLVFGTAGLRGIMGLGTNRMNIHVIRQGLRCSAGRNIPSASR